MSLGHDGLVLSKIRRKPCYHKNGELLYVAALDSYSEIRIEEWAEKGGEVMSPQDLNYYPLARLFTFFKNGVQFLGPSKSLIKRLFQSLQFLNHFILHSHFLPSEIERSLHLRK